MGHKAPTQMRLARRLALPELSPLSALCTGRQRHWEGEATAEPQCDDVHRKTASPPSNHEDPGTPYR
jgi:hypothetical protein